VVPRSAEEDRRRLLIALLAFGAMVAQAPACTQPPVPAYTSAPSVLPSSLAAAYPNGISVRYAVRFDATGAAVSRKIDDRALQRPLSAAARAVVSAWGSNATFVGNFYDCKWHTGTQYFDQDFFPAPAGVVGRPRVAGGVDFDNFHYTDGPGNCAKADLHDGEGNYAGEEYDAEIQDLFAGSIAGTPVAIVALRCEYNGHGFDMNAQLFAVGGGHAHRLAILGEGSMTGPDSGFPPWPGGSFHFAFANGKLYADVWDHANACSKTSDWIATSYTIRGGRLVKLNVLHHHRADDSACYP